VVPTVTDEEKWKYVRQVCENAYHEIGQYWQAHCDKEGYGPVNLMRRLERIFKDEL
jgi:hypothetical protein